MWLIEQLYIELGFLVAEPDRAEKNYLHNGIFKALSWGIKYMYIQIT